MTDRSKRLGDLAVIPDMISVTRGKVDAVFDDTNNAVNDPQSFFDPSPGLAETACIL